MAGGRETNEQASNNLLLRGLTLTALTGAPRPLTSETFFLAGDSDSSSFLVLIFSSLVVNF